MKYTVSFLYWHPSRPGFHYVLMAWNLCSIPMATRPACEVFTHTFRGLLQNQFPCYITRIREAEMTFKGCRETPGEITAVWEWAPSFTSKSFLAAMYQALVNDRVVHYKEYWASCKNHILIIHFSYFFSMEGSQYAASDSTNVPDFRQPSKKKKMIPNWADCGNLFLAKRNMLDR